MPGIAGVINPTSSREGARLALRMLESMRHDAGSVFGLQCAEDLNVYAGWVAREGSFAARVSSLSLPNRPRLLMAGECFVADKGGCNQFEDGGRFLSEFDAKGASCVSALNGLFSGLLLDPTRKTAALFNDRFGSERLYYCESKGAVFFASEAKALLRVLPDTRKLDEQGVAQLLRFGCTFDDFTLFHGIRLLPGGTLWSFGPGRTSTRTQYFRPEEWQLQPVLGEVDFEKEFDQIFTTILPQYLTAETDVGISVTGGLDTRMILAGLPSERPHLSCYTYAASNGETLDVTLGRRVAQACGLPHHVLRIGDDFVAEFRAQVDRTVFITDGTAGPLVAHEIYLTDLAKRLSPIRVTGNYGSEILRGVSTFKPLGISRDLLDPALACALDAVVAPDAGMHPVTRAAFAEIPWRLFGTLAAARSLVTVRSPFLDNRIVKLAYQAPLSALRSTRSATKLIQRNAPGLARIPTDRGLIPSAGRLATIIQRAFCEVTFKLDYLHTEGLPDWLSPLDPLVGALSKVGLLGLHKFLPYRSWFRRDLVGYMEEVMNDSRVRQSPYWNQRFVQTMVAEHVSGRRNYLSEFNAVLTLEAVERLLIRGMGENGGECHGGLET